ncbi:Hypothetical predicted protein [Pelobates cultripes]|uniref:Uncharacterized protein n=1 Tax=Pelobates cultripes TaxID=61616 RepID=A0AAD1R6A8_PELCU|nr:Hypothetical predicted protein [Pelobates cultripes]
MDPGHHTAFLLAILVCILLLILAVSALLACYWRYKCSIFPSWKSTMRIQKPMKDHATSMTSFTLNAMDPKQIIYNGPRTPQTSVMIPSMVDQPCEKENLIASCLSIDSHIVALCDEDECSEASELANLSGVKEKSATDRYSSFQCMLSSRASIFSSMLEIGSMLSMKLGRRSSSLKSGVDVDIMLGPLESPVKVASSGTGQHRASSLPRDPNRSTILCENSADQSFTWNTAGLSILSHHAGYKESFSVPGTLQRKACVSVLNQSSGDYGVKFRNPDCPLQPKTFPMLFGNRPLSDGAQISNGELENVTSLDSGVDIVAMPMRPECGTPVKNETDLKYTGGPGNSETLTLEEVIKRNQVCGAEQNCIEDKELVISHQEAARKLNGRTLWQKREERPLIGIS